MPDSSNGNGVTRVKLLFADRGEFHAVTVSLPNHRLDGHDRLVDLLREPSVTRQLYIDFRRLVSAVVEGEEPEEKVAEG